MNLKEQKKTTTLLDIHTVAFLELNGIPAELENLNGRIIFTFPQSDKLNALCNAYNSNQLVAVADYVAVLRTLKARMFSMRGPK